MTTAQAPGILFIGDISNAPLMEQEEARSYAVVFSGVRGRSRPSKPTHVIAVNRFTIRQVKLVSIPQNAHYERIEIYRTFTDFDACDTKYRLAAVVPMGTTEWLDDVPDANLKQKLEQPWQ